MTEQEYIDATDIEKVRSAKEALQRIVPANSSVVNPIDYDTVMKIIYAWEHKLYKTIKIR